MDQTRKLTILIGASLIILIIAAVLLSPLGGVKLLPSLASDDDAEFQHAMAQVRVVVEQPGATVDWVSVYRAILRLKELRDPRCAPLLARLLVREEPLHIVEGSPLPGVMPPLEMLKAAAIDTLVEVGAREYLPAIQSLYQHTHFMVLHNVAGRAIEALEDAAGG